MNDSRFQYYSDFLCYKWSSYLRSEDRKEDGKKQINQRKAKVKKDSIRSRHSRKMVKKSGKLYYGYKKHIGGE
ncbi:MAG: hypothetical protein ACMUEL_09670 [Flavobacteriales bacterium Tduv]